MTIAVVAVVVVVVVEADVVETFVVLVDFKEKIDTIKPLT